jgi:hypothetical protein
MSRTEFFEDLRPILDAIRDIIKKGSAEIGEEKPGTGWEYCGAEVSRQVSILEDVLNKTEFQVSPTQYLFQLF